MAAQYYSSSQLARHYPRRDLPALTNTRRMREEAIRNGSAIEATFIAQHYLRYQCGNGLRDTVREMRNGLAKHAGNRIKTLTIKDPRTRREHLDSWYKNYPATWLLWPYQLRQLIAENVMPALVAATRVNPGINRNFYDGVVRAILQDINHLDAIASELPFMDRMLMPWRAELEPIFARLEQIAHSILLEVGPSEG